MLLNADALALPLADESVQCVVTSPPYWGLRSYETTRWVDGDPSCSHSPADTPRRRGVASSTLDGGKQATGHNQEGYLGDTCPRCGARRVDGQLGLETTVGEYVAAMVAVFREVRRVLRVLDPFSGSGTTGMVVRELGRRYVGCDLSFAYSLMASRRLETGTVREIEILENPFSGLPLFAVEAE